MNAGKKSLVALGLAVAVAGSFGAAVSWAEDNAQAVDPVNIQGKQATPQAAEPTAVPTPASTVSPSSAPPATPATPSTPVVTGDPTTAPHVIITQEPPPPATAPGSPTATPTDVTAIPGPTPQLTPTVEPQPAATAPDTASVPAPATPDTTTAPAATDTAATPATEPSSSVATDTTTQPEVPATQTAAVPVITLSGPPPVIPASSALATKVDGKAYPVSGIRINYFKPQPGQPSILSLLETPVRLGVTKDGLVAPHEGVPQVTLRLGDIGRSAPQKIYRSAIEACYLQVVRFYNAKGIIGVFVVVDSKDIDASDNDIRPSERSTLQFIVVTSSVKQVRTLGTGDRIKKEERVNNPRHRAIREHSPLQAGEGREDLLNKDALDEYVLRLNRQPGRRVDVAISGTGQLGGVNLDYLVAENRPWYVYAQASNTGTAQTNTWRERFGLVDNQLTGHDDILTVDYSTAGFEASQAVIASYELPFFSFDALRYRIYGSWNEYTASDVGQSKETFTGSEWLVGNEMAWNFFQYRELFLDAVGGVRGQNVQTTGINGHGDATYISPYLSLRAERVTDLAATSATATLVGFFTDAEQQRDIVPLGRNNVDQDSYALQFEGAQTFFIEPLLNPTAFAAGQSTLAHEFYIGAHGQYGFNNRFIPQQEDVAGGLYSVRGYPESIVAGDTVGVITAEYRLHIPRLLPVQGDPTKTPFLWNKSFRYSPQQVYGHPDWDLIFRAFIDAAEVVNNKPVITENNSTLVGTGVGVELLYRQNLNIRVDWGMALTDVDSGTSTLVKEGDSRFHISATVLY